jgi:hypothetical protein
MVSLEVGGPHESSDGRAAMISESDIGAMIATWYGIGDLISRISHTFVEYLWWGSKTHVSFFGLVFWFSASG